MNRQRIIDTISQPEKALSPHDMTADEKKRLYLWMQQHGSTESLAYKRFFQDGFAQWELQGVAALQIDFLHYLHTEGGLETEVRQNNDNGCRHYYRTDRTDQHWQSFSLNTPGDFWRFLGDVRRRQAFSDFMRQHGMLSAMTVAKRFSADDWRPWERLGIIHIITLWLDQQDMAAE